MKVNNKVELNLHRWVDIDHDRIEIQSQTLKREAFRYVLLHKPAGVVTTNADERGARTVFDILGDSGKGLKAVGRLDKETSGLLLFTNDHQLANRVTSPESGFSKTYVAALDRPIDPTDLRTLSEGVDIQIEGGEFTTRPARVALRKPAEVELSITEGKNRQIRKMFEELGYQVTDLRRIAVGPLLLRDLVEGESREMTSEELNSLKSALGSKQPDAIFRKSRSRYLGKNTRVNKSFPALPEKRADHPKSRSRFQGKSSRSGKPAFGPAETRGEHPTSQDRYQGRRSRGSKSAFGSGESKSKYPKSQSRFRRNKTGGSHRKSGR